jgi:membrane protein implicated in regulation of membrane protease activity
MEKPISWILVILGAALVLLEILLGAVSGFDFLLIGSAVLAGGLVGLVTGQYVIGLATAGVLSLLYVAFGRRRLRARLKRPGIPSNTDALLGQEVLVVEKTGCDHAGLVRHEGEEWRALLDERECPGAPPVPAGRRVRVRRIDGVTVFVVPLAGDDAAKEA